MSRLFLPSVLSCSTRIVVWMGLVLGSGSVASWLAFGITVTQKYLTLLILPCGLLWLFLMGLTFLLFARGERLTGFLCLLLTAAYWTASTGFLSCELADRLEGPYRSIDPLAEEKFDRIVLLGGGGSLGGNERAQGNAHGDRMILAAQMYHAGLTKTIVCTGASIDGLGDGQPSPSQVSQEVLSALAVPAEAMEPLGGRNTFEEFASLQEQLAGKSERIGLITSAWHLPRAMTLADKAGLTLTALPAGFFGGPVRPLSVQEYIMTSIPQSDCLMPITMMLREYVAMAVGR